jgi:hypothetical protein
MARKVEGERLDVVLERLRQSGEAQATPTPEEFQSHLSTERLGDRKPKSDSLRAEILDLTMPRISEPGIFQPARALSLLDHLRGELETLFRDDKEAGPLALRLIDDERARLQDLLDRINGGIAA